MRPLLVLLVLALSLAACASEAQSPPEDVQISAAVKAAPEPMREGATVLGYEADGTVTPLRQGDGTLVCLADDPQEEGFHAACYHEALAPFMKRGRELRREGYHGASVDSVRRAEIENGALSYPDSPKSLYNLTGESYDADTDSVREASRLRVLYVPYETVETMGLPGEPEGGPWLMAPGEPWAHVMMPE